MVANAIGDASVALGTTANAAGQGALAIGAVSNASQQGSIAVGINSTSSGTNATAIGSGSTSGAGAQATGANATAIGGGASASANGTAIGTGAKATQAGGVAIGTNSVSNVASGVAGYDPITGKSTTDTTNTWKSTQAAVSVGDTSSNVTRQITGLAAGTNDADAVNVAQLKKVKTYADNLGTSTATNLGGGSTVDSSGQVAAPTYTVGSNTYNNVGGAISGVNDSLKDVDGRVDTLENAFSQTNRDLKELRRDTSAGIAGAMAIGNLPQPSEPGLGMVSAGLGGYKGEGAVSVGVSAITDNNKYIWKFGASADTRSNVGGAVSVDYQWR